MLFAGYTVLAKKLCFACPRSPTVAYGGQDETGTWSAFRRKGGADTTSPETPELPKEASGESKETLPWSQKK